MNLSEPTAKKRGASVQISYPEASPPTIEIYKFKAFREDFDKPIYTLNIEVFLY